MGTLKTKGHEGTGKHTRRDFLKTGMKVSALVAAQPLISSGMLEAVASEPRTLLKNGLVVDGSGKPGFVGNVLVAGSHIEEVSARPIDVEAETVDCSGKVIAPGFIDVHSHMDRVLSIPGRPEMKSPFTAQGCTTFVAGNCGFAPGGFRKRKEGTADAGSRRAQRTGDTMAEYFDHLSKVGMSHNLITCVGHGTTRGSIRGGDPSPLSKDEMQEMLALLEEAMDDGACGVSFGLQYAPGIFATQEEVLEIARLVAKKGKIVTVHGRAYSAFSGVYPIKDGGTPHNVLSLQEMIDVARETGVRLQYSHLMFAGSVSHKTYGQCLEVLDKAVADGVDVMIDTYPYHCGTSVINVVIPPWFLANLPDNYHDEGALRRLESQLNLMRVAVGFGYEDIQLTNGRHPDLVQYNGMFLSEIATQSERKPFDVAMEISEKSRGGAGVLNHNYSNMEIIEELMKSKHCLFMTDAVPSSEGVQNPAAYGSFALLLQYARDRNLLSLEEAVRKMTGANAERVKLKERGFLRAGYAADITVFDWKGIKDNNTVTDTNNAPTGIEAVFMNGRRVLAADGRVDAEANAGVAFRA